MHPAAFHLIETIRVEKQGALFLELHLARMKASALFFNFKWDNTVEADVQKVLKKYKDTFPAKLRICLYFSGEITITINPYQDVFVGEKKIWLYPEPVASDYIYLYHKSSNRHFYDDTFAEASALGYREAIYLNERGELTEGSRTNIFLQQGDQIYTPPLYCGVLKGIYRKHLLNTLPNVSEKMLFEKDLRDADKIWCVNVLRKQEEVFI